MTDKQVLSMADLTINEKYAMKTFLILLIDTNLIMLTN